MSIFAELAKYLPLLENDNIGSWIIDRENDGTPEHPLQMPFVNYSEMVHRFIDDVYAFSDNNKDFELTRYGEILERNGLEWGTKSMALSIELERIRASMGVFSSKPSFSVTPMSLSEPKRRIRSSSSERKNLDSPGSP